MQILLKNWHLKTRKVSIETSNLGSKMKIAKKNLVGSFHESPSVFPSSLCQCRIQIVMIKR